MKSDNKLFDNIVSFVSNQMSKGVALRTLKSKSNAKSFFDIYYPNMDITLKEEIKSELTSISFYDLSNYKNGVIDFNLYNQINLLSAFRNALIFHLDGSKRRTTVLLKEPLIRKVSPPLEAYEFSGNNKIDITHSDRSYGLLYE